MRRCDRAWKPLSDKLETHLQANTAKARFALVCVIYLFFLFGGYFVGLEHLCLPRSSLIPCTLLSRLLKHRPHCCSHRGKASAELFCLYCKRQRERERAGKETRLRYWLFCLAASEPRWCGKKRKTSCVLFMTEWQTLPRGITGLADRLSQAVLQPASLRDPFCYGA